MPRCTQRKILRDGQHGIHTTCWQTMRYNRLHNWWRCPACGTIVSGEMLVASQRLLMAA